MVRFLARAARALCVTAFAVFCTVICLGAGVAQALTVISAMPEGEVRDLTQITVRFSETMRPLGVMDEKAKDAPLKLSVSNGKLPKGTFRWLDPSTLAYLFDAPLNRPLTIRALVPNGTAALSGETLDRDVAWTVTTPPLTLRADNPEDAPLPRTKATLVLHANYPLSLKQLREKSRLTVNGETRPFSIKKPDAAEYYQGRQSSWRYTYAIKGSLPKNGTVKLDIGPGLTARGGGDPAGKASFSFRGYGDLRLASWNMGGYGSTEKKGSPRPENRLTLTWNNPVGYGDLLAHITVTPEAAVPDGKKLPISGFMPSPSATGTGFTLPHVWEPRTAYTVTIRPGLKDRYGTTLAKEEVITFTTGDYQPYLLMPRGSVVMETELSRLFPLTMRNARTVTAAARYLPWGEDAFRVLRGGSARGDELVPESGKAETAAIVVDTDDFPNKTLRRDLDIPSAFGRSPSEGMRGLVALRLVPPEKDGGDDALARLYANRNLEANVQITDLGVAARLGDDASLVWVAAFSSGKPVSGASVRLLDKDGNTIWSGETDSRGLALPPGLASFSAIPAFCMAETGNDASVLDLATSGLPADKAAYAERLDQASPWAVHAVTQLSLYRPGQTVNTALYARRYTDVSGKAGDYPAWLPVAGEKLQVSVQDRNGKVVHTFEAVTNAYGSAPFSLTLSPEAEPGWYTVRARSERFPYEAAATPFRVAAFRPPEFKVDVTPPPSQPLPVGKDKGLPVSVAAGYFSGALLPNGKVDMDVSSAATYFTPPRLAGYTTGPGGHPYGREYFPRDEQRRATLSGTLDDKGTATLELPETEKSLRPQTLFMAATVTDASGLTSQGAASTLLHPSAYYIGTRSPFTAPRGKEFAIPFKAATWDNEPVTGKAVTFKAERVIWENGEEKTETAWEKTVVLADETGDRLTAAFDAAGQYRLTASILDEKGRENVAVSRIYVPGPGMGWITPRPYVDGYSSEERGLDILAEDVTHKPGGVARLVIKDPVENATALVAIERGGVRRTLLCDVSGDNPVIEIPLEKADAPSVLASVLLVTGRTAPPPDAGAAAGKDAAIADEGAPSLRQGTVLLKVSGAEPGLAATVTTDAAEYKPGGTVTATATVTDSGMPRQAQVTFLAVDERVLRAGGESTTYDPRQSFAPLYPNAVFSADLWRFLLRHHALPAGPDQGLHMARAMAAAPAMDAAKAGGMAEDPDIALRDDFTPLAFWLAEGETDADGVLTVSFALPDTLTRYRVVAVAADKKDGFATAQTSIRASKPLQLLPALPKFVIEGDTLTAGILVQNTGRERGEASVTLRASGPLAAGTPAEQTRTVGLEAGRSVLATFPLTMAMLDSPEGELRLRVTGRMGTETDEAAFVLPVKPLRPLTTVAAAGLLGEGETYTLPVKAPANLDPRSRLDVTFAPSPAAGIALAARQAIAYPWNCLEQRLSRAWARIIRLEHGALIGLAPDAADRDAVMEEFRAVPSHQREDGSFGLWSGAGGSDDGGVSLFLTSYALLVGHAGKGAGISLPDDVTDKALAYIEKTLANIPGTGKKKKARAYTSPPDAYALALRVLALHRPDRAASLFARVLAVCETDETNPLGWGALLLVLDETGSAKADTAERVLGHLEKTAAVTPTHLHFASTHDNGYWLTLGSTLRDNAMVLAALAKGRAGYPRLEALAAWVGQKVGDTRALTTQEAAFGLWGLAEYLGSLGGDRETEIHAVWNGKNEVSAAFTRLMQAPASWSLPMAELDGGNASNLNLTAIKGRPYWTARLAYASPDLPLNVENAGFTVRRKVNPEGPWKVGDTVTVTVTLTVPATRRHVALFAPFPAGFEPLYATRADLMDREKSSGSLLRHDPWRWEDALDDGLLLYAPEIQPGTYDYTYTLRAVVAGSFGLRPVTVEEMYSPEVFGGTDSGVVTVRGE